MVSRPPLAVHVVVRATAPWQEPQTFQDGKPAVETSLLEVQIFMLDFQASRWLIAKEVAKQAGNDHPTGIPTGVFPSSDRCLS